MAISFLGTINTFFEPYRPIRYAKGQVFLLEGEKSEHIYYLVEGRVKVYTISYRGDEVILHVYKPYDFFPISHVLNQTTNNYIYEADTETVVRRAPIDKVRKLLNTQPSVTLELLRQSYDYIDDFLDKQSLLMAGSARLRLLYELVILCRYFSTEDSDDRYVLDIREKELAARTGLSRETINREVKELKKEKVITLTHRQIIIPHINNLEQKLNQSV